MNREKVEVHCRYLLQIYFCKSEKKLFNHQKWYAVYGAIVYKFSARPRSENVDVEKCEEICDKPATFEDNKK